MIGRKLRELLIAPDQRVLRAEARFFDSYCRGGYREPRDLVIPIDFFARRRVRAILREWLLGERPLDVDGLCAEWHAAVPSALRPEEGLFFRNLADFVSLVGPAVRAAAPDRRVAAWLPPRPLEPWRFGRRRG